SGGANVFVLRTNVPPMSLAADVRRAIHDVLPNVPVAKVTTLADQVDASILPERLVAMLSQLLGIAAALLLTIGLDGLLAYTVTQRLHEIGIRIAIGATHRDVSWMVLANALRLVVTGVIIGVPLALWTKGYAGNVLSAMAASQAEKPVTLPLDTAAPIVVAAFAMLTIALIASYVPARRAMKVDPIAALRTE